MFDRRAVHLIVLCMFRKVNKPNLYIRNSVHPLNPAFLTKASTWGSLVMARALGLFLWLPWESKRERCSPPALLQPEGQHAQLLCWGPPRPALGLRAAEPAPHCHHVSGTALHWLGARAVRLHRLHTGRFRAGSSAPCQGTLWSLPAGWDLLPSPVVTHPHVARTRCSGKVESIPPRDTL